MRQQVMLNWRAGTSFGWGLVGLNLLQCWGSDLEIQPLFGERITAADCHGMDPLRALAISRAVAASNEFVSDLKAGRVDWHERPMLLVDSVGNGLNVSMPQYRARRNVGRCILEDTHIADAAQRLAKYDSLVCGSRWGAALLRAHTSKPVALVHEGIDHAQFFPGPRSGALNPGRFYIFSGGKVEFRKAHDLVVLAFREFAARHDDAVLVSAWHSPWPQLSEGFQGRLRVPLARDAQGALAIRRWVVENGVEGKQFVELPPTPNPMMPQILREMDCALQVSRCEACTNLPAMEAMACGVPVVLADNTGMRDLVDEDNCVALRSQEPVTDAPTGGTEGWGESRVDEIVAALERLYSDTEARQRIAARGARWIAEQRRTWRDHAAMLKSQLLSLV